MTHDELWKRAVDTALDHIESSWCEKQIRILLYKAHGNITEALRLFSVPNEYGDSIATMIGHFGSSCVDLRVQCIGSAASNKLEAWFGSSSWGNPPDIVITWREIFDYVKHHRERAIQLSLFASNYL